MTAVQQVLKDLRQNNTTTHVIECYETKNMNNGYYKLSLVNGNYSYVTTENFQKIKPYVFYKVSA